MSEYLEWNLHRSSFSNLFPIMRSVYWIGLLSGVAFAIPLNTTSKLTFSWLDYFRMAGSWQIWASLCVCILYELMWVCICECVCVWVCICVCVCIMSEYLTLHEYMSGSWMHICEWSSVKYTGFHKWRYQRQ